MKTIHGCKNKINIIPPASSEFCQGRYFFKPSQGGSKISTTGIPGVFQGLKFLTNAEIGQNGTF
jgi:hypothetical protein